MPGDAGHATECDDGRDGAETRQSRDRRLDRRAFVTLAGGAVASTLAGCSDSAGDESGTTTGPPRDETAVSVMTEARPGSLDMGPNLGAVQGRPHFEGFLHSLVLPRHAPTGEWYTSGHTWDVDGSELSVPCVVESYEIEESGAVATTFDDRLTYWNGEPLDARSYHVRDRIRWLEADGAFRAASFDGDLVSRTEYRWAPTDEPTNPTAARSVVHPGMPPLPPSYSREWLERYEEATTEEAVRTVTLDYRQGKLSIETFVEDGYGTGRYEVRSADDIETELIEVPHNLRTNTEVVYAEPREPYPGPSDRPTLRIVCGVSGVGRPGLRSRVNGDVSGTFYDPRDVVHGGEADFGTGVIARPGGDLYPNQVPEAIEQLPSWSDPAGGGMQLTFNWSNDHLRRLWVRRALAAAAPFERSRRNVYGAGSATPSTHSGMLGDTDVSALGSAFVDSLYEYPMAADYELAASWLRRAGYERTDGLWVGPDGDPLALTFSVFAADVSNVKTLAAGLRSFGVGVDVWQLLGRGTEYQDAVTDGQFDLLLTHVPRGHSPNRYYGDWFDAGNGWAATPPITVARNPLGSCQDDPDAASVPETVTLPSDPGSLAIEGVEYSDGGRVYEWDAGERVALCDAVDRLWAAETDESTFRKAARQCARWYNYALPSVVFVEDRSALWANTERAAVATAEERSLAMSRGEPVAPVHYHVQAGTLRRASG